MECCFEAAFNTKGFDYQIKKEELPEESHLTYGGEFH